MSVQSGDKQASQLTVGYDRKEQIRCMLCGGKECSKCGLEAYKKLTAPAIELLHSHWITDKIVGMQRPNETSLSNGALDDMVKKKFTAIFNLTEPGEHPFCGCGTLPASGFPYMPETVMARGIKHFNFNWRDMTVPTLDMMDQIVSIACHEIQHGGKIAVHCHAGFGRTGLAIACILIANDHLSAESVITFVRNRRPGSIQTAAQQQFILRYEKHRQLMMQVFPTYEEIDDKLGGSRGGKSFVAYPKSIAVSIEDQRHFFSQQDQLKTEYRYVHKVVHLTSRAISRLCFDHFSVACLAITGLNKLTVKRNSIDAGRDSDTHAARAESLASRPQLLRKKSSFMVATNSLSESSEESMLTEIKHELNQNNFARMISLADVISADFRAKGESLSNLERKVSQKILGTGSGSLRTMSKRSLNGSQRGLMRDSSSPHVSKDQLSVAQRSSLSLNQNQGSKTRLGLENSSFEQPKTVESHSMSSHKGTNSRENLRQSRPSAEELPKVKLAVEEEVNVVENDKISVRKSSNFNKLSVEIVSSTNGEDAVDNGGTGFAIISRPHSSRASSTNGDNEKAHNTSAKERSSSPGIPKISLPSPGSLIRGLSARSMNNDNSQSNVSGNNTSRSNASNTSGTSPLTAIRANSLRMNTDQDYAKSKKMAANLIAQLLLDWLETRSDCIFNAENVNSLQDIWAQYGGIPKVTEDKLGEENSSRSVSEKVSAPAASSVSAVPVASSPGEIQEDFYEDELIQALYTHLAQTLSRQKLELLSALVEMYRFIRLAGFEYTVKLQAMTQEQANLNNANSNTGIGASGSAGSVGSETQALDALVGLRLAIACMHARKKNSNLVRRRGLIIDLVKVFLLKSSSSEYVIINNITFSAENFSQIQHNIGVVLLGKIDVVFRTLNLLVDTQWTSSYKKLRSKHRGQIIFDANKVGWRDVNAVQDFSNENSSHS